MSSRLLTLSLALNLILLGMAGYWVATNSSHVNAPAAASALPQETEVVSRNSAHVSSSAVSDADVPLRWNELESGDHATFVANLRRVGCPEPVLRRIIAGELDELYAQEAAKLTQTFHRDFWEIAARENVDKHFEKNFAAALRSLREESDALLIKLVGRDLRALPKVPEHALTDHRLVDFLSSEKQAQLKRLAEDYESHVQLICDAKLSPDEKSSQLEQLRQKTERERAAIFSPEELAEYRLRQCAATQLQHLQGEDFSESELHSLAKTIDDYNRRPTNEAETNSDTLEQELQALLGPDRFADFKRASSASYRELCEVVLSYGQSRETAAEIFDLRLESEKQSDAIRADKNRSAAEKQALLDAVQDNVEQAVINKFGAEGFQSFKTKNERWINSLGRL